MFWTGNDDDDDEANLLYSPALIARRASESWIDTLPAEVFIGFYLYFRFVCLIVDFFQLGMVLIREVLGDLIFLKLFLRR